MTHWLISPHYTHIRFEACPRVSDFFLKGRLKFLFERFLHVFYPFFALCSYFLYFVFINELRENLPKKGLTQLNNLTRTWVKSERIVGVFTNISKVYRVFFSVERGILPELEWLVQCAVDLLQVDKDHVVAHHQVAQVLQRLDQGVVRPQKQQQQLTQALQN